MDAPEPQNVQLSHLAKSRSQNMTGMESTLTDVPAPKNIIYAALDHEDRVVYIGRSSRGLVRRVNEHIYSATHDTDRTTFHDWIWRVGPEAVQWKILRALDNDCHREQLAAAEAKAIRDYKPELNRSTPHGFYLALDLV